MRFSLVNEHNTQPAYFDDFEIVHKPNAEKLSVTSWAEYYAFGKVAKASCAGLGAYRYGYQGEFAEKDQETDWNSFELRQYDSDIARWLSVDPYQQYWSPYVGMGNDPVNQIDPDGGLSGGGGNGDKNPPTEYLGDNSYLPEIVVTPTGNYVGAVANFVTNNPVLHQQIIDFKKNHVPPPPVVQPLSTGAITPHFVEQVFLPIPKVAVAEYYLGKTLSRLGLPKPKPMLNVRTAGFGGGGVEKITDKLLKQSGIDAHQLKKGWLGDKAQISLYDLYKDKATGEILIMRKGGIGEPIRTGEFL